MSSLEQSYEHQMRELADQVGELRTAFRTAGMFLRRTFRKNELGGGWRQFLNEQGPPTVGGTSCAVSSLANIGMDMADEMVDSALALFRASIEPDGGWTRPWLRGATSTTLVTCLAARAIIATGRHSQDDLLASGIRWLLAAQNDDHGWGNLPRDGRSDVTSTSYAVRTLAAYRPNHDGLRAAAGWLMAQRHSDGSWGVDRHHPGTIAHTSHAVEALLLAGVSPRALHSSHEWITDKLPEVGLTPWVEHYNYPEDYHIAGLPAHDRMTWTHLPAERALIALLRLGHDPASDIIRDLVANLRARYAEDGYWQSVTVPGTAPAWVMIEATQALRLYLDRLETEGQFSAARRAWSDLASRLSKLEEAEREQRNRLEALHVEVEALSKRVSFLGRLGRALQSRTLLRLVIGLFTLSALVAYLLVGGDDDSGQRVVNIVTIVATGLGLLALVQRRRHDE